MIPHRQNRERARYAIYARTAAGGREQIDAQAGAARKAIATGRRAGCASVRVYADLNVAGGPGGPGPALAALLDDTAAGLLDVVVVTDVARLSRSAVRLREILAAFEHGGARVASVGEAG